MKKLKQDQLYGIFFVLLGIACLLVIRTIQPMLSLDPNDAGPKFFPTLISVGFILCGIGMISMPDPDKEAFLTKDQWIKILKFFGLLCLYLIGLKVAGYLIATPICLFLMINMLSEIPVKKWFAAVYSLGLALVIYLAFSKVLAIILPKGLLFY